MKRKINYIITEEFKSSNKDIKKIFNIKLYNLILSNKSNLDKNE